MLYKRSVKLESILLAGEKPEFSKEYWEFLWWEIIRKRLRSNEEMDNILRTECEVLC